MTTLNAVVACELVKYVLNRYHFLCTNRILIYEIAGTSVHKHEKHHECAYSIYKHHHRTIPVAAETEFAWTSRVTAGADTEADNVDDDDPEGRSEIKIKSRVVLIWLFKYICIFSYLHTASTLLLHADKFYANKHKNIVNVNITVRYLSIHVLGSCDFYEYVILLLLLGR